MSAAIETAPVSDRGMTADLMARLKRHYIKPGQPFAGGVFIPEIGWNGSVNTTRCDALYVGFTGSSGRLLVGHEVKASRADWLHELDQPWKSEPWSSQCHSWWIVAPHVSIVRPDELPAGWGLLLPGRSKTRMEIAVSARVDVNKTPSWDATRSILARLDTLQVQSVADAKDKAQREISQQVNEQSAKLREQWSEKSGDSQAVGTLRLISDVVQMEIRAWGDNAIAAPELDAAVRRYIEADRDLQRAARGLVARYGDGLSNARQTLENLDSALAVLRKIAAS